VLPWPAQSLGINPIENLWAIMKHELYAAEVFSKSLAELVSFLRHFAVNRHANTVEFSTKGPEKAYRI
jgi:transposase